MDVQDGWDQPYNPGEMAGAGPTGIPDPNNPGYDTAGYPLPQGRTQPPTANVPPPGNVPINGQPNVTQPPPATATGTGGTPGPVAPKLASGALAPYDVPAPDFPTEPAYAPSQFQAPSVSDALNDPGYQFERDESLNGLQRWAAARGTLNDTGTATALMDVGRNAATQRLGDVWGRAFTGWNANEDARRQAYGMNRMSQYIDPWTAKYNAWAQQGNFYLNNQSTVANTALGFANL